MKIELVFTPYQEDGLLGCFITLGKFRTKKAAYQYVKANRKLYGKGVFDLHIDKKYVFKIEPVRAQDILNV